MVTGDVAARAIVTDLVLQWYFHDRGDAVAAAEIVMVVKYCDAIVLFSYIDTGMFLSVAPCNATGNSTTVKLVDRKIIPQLTITSYALKFIS